MKTKVFCGLALLSVGLILFSCKKDEPVVEETPASSGTLIVDGESYVINGCGFEPYGEVDADRFPGLFEVDLNFFKKESGLYDDNSIYFEMITTSRNAVPDGSYDYFYDVITDSSKVFTFEEAYIYVGLDKSSGEYAREYDIRSGRVTVTNTATGVVCNFSGQALVDVGPKEGQMVDFSGSYTGTKEIFN